MEPFISRRQVPALPPKFYQRLLNFYGRQPHFSQYVSLTWKTLHAGFLAPLLVVLREGKIPELANVLGNLYQNKIMYGLDSSAQFMDEYDLGLGKELHLSREFFLSGCLDLLRAVANNFGSIGAPNPEQGGPVPSSPEQMLGAIESGLGCRLDFPGGGGVSGLELAGRYIPHRLISAAGIFATAARLDCWPPRRVLEIGAGAGWLGYLLMEMAGVSYHTIDLPAVSVIQAAMLAMGTSPDLVWLGGEPPDAGEARSFIHGISPPTWNEGHFDLVINENSFPEISPPQQDQYVALLERVIRPGGVFLSINHESDKNEQRRVYASLSKSPHFKLVHRSPWWQRPGWIEEEWRHL